MKNIEKKLMLFVIAILLLFLSLGYTILKVTEATDKTIVETIYVSNYSQLSAAVDKVNLTSNKYMIVLKNNIQLDTFLQIGSEDSSITPNVILDLQSYFITSKEYDAGFNGYKQEYGLINYGNLEINATTGGIKTSSTDSLMLSDMLIVNHNTMTINGGNYYDGATVGYAQIINNYGKMTINDGSFVLKKHSSIMLANSGELIINNGTFDFTVLEGSNDESFVNKSGGQMTINGGSITGGGYGIVNYSQLVINDGSVVGNTAAISNGRPANSNFDENSVVNIKGGTIVTDVKGDSGSGREVIYNSGVVQIDSGEFKITNSLENINVAILYNYGTQTINGGTFIAETSTNGNIYGIRNLSDSAYTDLNGGIIKLKNPDISKITLLYYFYNGTTNIDDKFSIAIKSDGIYKFIKFVDTSGYFSSDEGDGSEENPYQISNVEQLDAIRYFLDKNFILMNDLNLEYDTTNENGLFYNGGLGWDPIGNFESASNDNRFEGIFDGNYYTISGLNINRSSEEYVGLFGASTGTIKNLAVVNSNIIGGQYVGSIVGYNWGEVTTVLSASNVRGNSNVGGIAGYVYNPYYTSKYLSNAVNLGNIYGTNKVGGTNSNICKYCYNTGIVTGDENVGSLYSSSVLDNFGLVLRDNSTITSFSITNIDDINSEVEKWDNSIWEVVEIDGIKRLPRLKNFNFEYITAIDILEKDVSLSVGDKIKYEVTPINDYNKNVFFVSGDESVITFQDDGTISTLNDGNTTVSIYSLYDGFVKSFPIQVKDNKLILDAKYKVTYEPNGGTLTGNSFEVSFNSTYGELLIPTKKGYTFKGWYLEESFDIEVTKDTMVTMQKDHTLYAKWEINNYKLTIDSNGGEYDGERELILNYNATVEIAIPQRDFYIFNGWEVSGMESIIEDTVFKMGVSDTALVAKWELAPVNIEDISDYIVKGNLIRDISPDLKINEININLGNIYVLKIYDRQGREKDDGIITTGDKIRIYLDDVLIEEYTAVVNGDINGDGIININDVIGVARHVIKGDYLEEIEYIDAADIDNNDKVNINDTIKLAKQIINNN